MRSARTLSLYLMRETLAYCALAFAILTIVVLTQNLLRRLDELFLVGMTPADVGRALLCLLPIALTYSIPLAFLLGCVLATRRMSGDGELEGLRASGVGPIRLLIPFLILGLLASALSAWLLQDVDHQSRRELVQLFKRVAARGAILEPGKFRHIGGHLVFVEERSRDGSLSGVMIYDQTRPDRPYRIFASHGRFLFDAETAEIQLDLEHGDVHLDPSPDDPRRYERIRFDQFSYRLNVAHLVGMDWWPVRPKQMTVPELERVLERAAQGDALRELDQRDPIEYALEIHRRRALPFASLLLAAVGIPIALASEHRGRNAGLLLVMGSAFAYFALGTLVESLASVSWIGAGVATWLPNLVYAGLAVALILRGRRRIAE